MMVSRYLLHRCAEEFGLSISFEPKIFADWNGSGCHTNFSTKTMRAGTGKMAYIDDMMKHFEKKHSTHIELYGADNHKRLTGLHETSSVTKFTYGCGNRACSFRIPTQTMHDDGKGYIEDRRPASNICPYTVSAIIFDTGCDLGKGEELVSHYKKWSKFMETAVIEKP